MTLVVVSQIALARGPTLLVATDSMLSAGFRWPRGPKLFALGANCVMAFEGDTELAYPLLTNGRNFIALSDHLSSVDAEPAAIFERVQLDLSEAYKYLAESAYFDAQQSTCSIVLAGWSWRLAVPAVRTLHPPEPGAPAGTEWTMTDVVASQQWRQHASFFAGNGDKDPVKQAWRDLTSNTAARLPAYAAFLAQLRDDAETAVGGAPQVALLGPRAREIIGVRNQAGQRFLLGHLVQSGAQDVTYYDEALTMLK